jgi:hypothetical protein
MRALLLVTGLLAGCQESTLKNLEDGEGDLDAQLVADPGAVMFGDLDITATASEVVTLTSTGAVSVTLLDAAIVGDGAFTMSWGYQGTVLDPGDSVDVTITYYPSSLDDDAQLIVYSTAVDDELIVPLSGAILAPAITVTPSPMLFEADNSEPVIGDLFIENIGTAPLMLSEELLIDEGHFTILSSPVPSELEVGEVAVMTIEYSPDSDIIDDSGELWIGSDAPSSPTLVPLLGTQPPSCLGLSEAWDRGMLDLYSRFGSSITIENLSVDYDICVDRWYVYMGVETQDAIGGDPGYDPGAEYPLGTITVSPGEAVELSYAEDVAPAWWCVEQTQVTNTTYNFTFIGARAPTPLLDRAFLSDQDAIWDYQTTNPAVAVGRNIHYIELIRSSEAERVAEAEVTVVNMGEEDVTTLVTEIIPPGFVATDFSQDYLEETELSDGSVRYTFIVALDARIPTESIDTHTIYDDVDINYTLTLDDPDACVGRLTTASPTAEWGDSSGEGYTSTGSPMIIHCR